MRRVFRGAGFLGPFLFHWKTQKKNNNKNTKQNGDQLRNGGGDRFAVALLIVIRFSIEIQKGKKRCAARLDWPFLKKKNKNLINRFYGFFFAFRSAGNPIKESHQDTKERN